MLLRTKILSIFLLLFLGSYIYLTSIHDTERAEINIKRGMNANEIANLLKEKNVIKDKNIFILFLKLKKAQNKIKAGIYEFSLPINLNKLINILIKGKSKLIKVTIPEGLTTEQVAEIIEQKRLGSKKRILEIVRERNLEGYLFPETYFFAPETPEEVIIDRMVRQFHKVFTWEMKQKAKQFNFTERDVVILASIIEKEAKLSSEKPLISAVFHNRLKKRYYLESCATVEYALGKHKKKLSYKDLKINSPYNTYTHFGLPPGPICNPGFESLKYAINPAESDVMFFVSKGDGSHKFFSDFREHIRYKLKRKKSND